MTLLIKSGLLVVFFIIKLIKHTSSNGRRAMEYADERVRGSRGASRESAGSQQGASNYPAVGWMARENLANMSRPSKKSSAQSMGGWPPK